MVIYMDIEATKNNEMAEVDGREEWQRVDGREKGSKLDTESSMRVQQESDDRSGSCPPL